MRESYAITDAGADLTDPDWRPLRWSSTRTEDDALQSVALPEVIGTRLEAVRTRLGWGVSEAARQADVHRQVVYRVEVGERRDPQASTLLRLCDAYGVHISEIIPPARETEEAEESG